MILGVPAELLSIICDTLPRKDLKSARLVCKDFNDVAEPHLFATVYLRVHLRSFERLKKIASDARLAKLVKSLDYDSTTLYDNGMSSWEFWCKEFKKAEIHMYCGPPRPLETRLCRYFSNADFSAFHENYISLLDAQDDVLRGDFEFQQLEEILALLPGLNVLKGPSLEDVIPSPNCIGREKISELISFNKPRITAAFITTSTGHCIFDPISCSSRFQTLLRAAHKSPHFKQIKFIQGDSFYGTTCFEDGAIETFLAPSAITLSKLEHADLSIAWEEGEIPRDQIVCEMSNVVSALSSSSSLRVLRLDFRVVVWKEVRDKAPFHMVVKPSYHWTRLSVLRLAGFVFRLDELSIFLASHKRSLRVVEFENIAFKTTDSLSNPANCSPLRDSFFDLVHFLRRDMKLTKITFNKEVRSGRNSWWAAWPPSLDDCLILRIQSYVIGNGPFPKELQQLENAGEGLKFPQYRVAWDKSLELRPDY